jgi:hypothetical protein
VCLTTKTMLQHISFKLSHFITLCNITVRYRILIFSRRQVIPNRACVLNGGSALNTVCACVCRYVCKVSLCAASQTCRRWHELAADDSVWRSYCLHTKWRLAPAEEQKQLAACRWPDDRVNVSCTLIGRFIC